MSRTKVLNSQRTRRRFRVRNHVKRVSTRPRLSVFRSRANIYVQIIDDESGRTLASASSMEKDFKAKTKYGGNKDAAKLVGKTIAERAVAAGIKEVAFDRGSYKYHGRIAAVAEGAREGGLQF
jgi:large subunit ribosomal protein L18